jgi:hypothetical protein
MLDTARLMLEPLSRAHLEPWLRFMMNGDARAGLHTPDPTESEAQAAAGLDRFAEVATMYALVVREMPACRGRGYATEAAAALRPLEG